MSGRSDLCCQLPFWSPCADQTRLNFSILSELGARKNETFTDSFVIRNIPDVVSLFLNPCYYLKLYFGSYRRVFNDVGAGDVRLQIIELLAYAISATYHI